jgi:hypothetical protein
MFYWILISICRCLPDSDRLEIGPMVGFFLYNTVGLITFTSIRLSVHGKGSWLVAWIVPHLNLNSFYEVRILISGLVHFGKKTNLMPRHDIHLKRDLMFSFSFYWLSVEMYANWSSITWEEIKCIRIDKIKIQLFLPKSVCSMCLKLSQFIFLDFVIVVVEFCEEYIHGSLSLGFLYFLLFFSVLSLNIYLRK